MIPTAVLWGIFQVNMICFETKYDCFSHASACHVYIHVCSYRYRNSINKCTTMTPTEVLWGVFQVNMICFETKHDANL